MSNQTPTFLEQFFQLLIRLNAPVGTLITDSTPYDQKRRPILNLIGATYEDDPTNNQGVLTVSGGGGGSGVNVQVNGAPIANNPHLTLDFVSPGATGADSGGSTAIVTLPTVRALTLARVNTGTSPLILVVFQRASVDVSGGPVIVAAPASPADNDMIGCKATIGNPGLAGHSLTVQGNGHAIEDPAVPGTYPVNVVLTAASQSVDWQYDATNARWMIV